MSSLSKLKHFNETQTFWDASAHAYISGLGLKSGKLHLLMHLCLWNVFGGGA